MNFELFIQVVKYEGWLILDSVTTPYAFCPKKKKKRRKEGPICDLANSGLGLGEGEEVCRARLQPLPT